jgi:acyl-CoA reductase-like NAD-dependent aldehyde dehydrogenase
VVRVTRIRVGDLRGPSTPVGAQCSKEQPEKTLGHIDASKLERAKQERAGRSRKALGARGFKTEIL